MSIEMDNPKTKLEMADAISNLIEQMHMAHMMRDESRFKEAHKKAGKLAFELVQMLEEQAQ